MLKIKEEIDLKELEKYGFQLKKYVDDWVYEKELKVTEHYKEVILVWGEDRTIQIGSAIRILDTLYELINDGLIQYEKEQFQR